MEPHEDQKDPLLRHDDSERDAQLEQASQLPKPWIASCRPSSRFLTLALLGLSVLMNLVAALRYFTAQNTPPWMVPSLYSMFFLLSPIKRYYLTIWSWHPS